MKKVYLSLVLLFITALNTNAQAPIEKGQFQLNAGVGMSSWGIPVYLGFDYGVHTDITIGLEGSYRTYRNNFLGYKYKHTVTGFAFNGNYHFNTLLDIPSEWDFYAGLNIGFYIWHSPSDYQGSQTSGLGVGGQIGGRYYFNEKVGINLEFGGGNAFSGGKIGISIKL